MITPKKSLGQNFLIDNNIIRKIIESLQIEEDDFILEIGPGMGALTNELVKVSGTLVAVDADKRAIEVLSEKYNGTSINLIHSDIRDINLQELVEKSGKKKVKIIGNIPYNISSDISFWIFDNRMLVDSAVIMYQREVAKRFTSAIRTKDYGILRVAIDLIGTSKLLFDVAPKCFKPVPKVVSSVVKFRFNENSNIEFNEIMKLVKAAFNQRRKTLKNALKNYVETNTKEPFDIFFNRIEIQSQSYFTKRAEELMAKDYIALYDLLNN